MTDSSIPLSCPLARARFAPQAALLQRLRSYPVHPPQKKRRQKAPWI